jgi:hypothetical protein
MFLGASIDEVQIELNGIEYVCTTSNSGDLSDSVGEQTTFLREGQEHHVQQNNMEPGNWQFLFHFTLPTDAPNSLHRVYQSSSCMEESCNEFKISYSIEVVVRWSPQNQFRLWSKHHIKEFQVAATNHQVVIPA